jgi:hypothetical protein
VAANLVSRQIFHIYFNVQSSNSWGLAAFKTHKGNGNIRKVMSISYISKHSINNINMFICGFIIEILSLEEGIVFSTYILYYSSWVPIFGGSSLYGRVWLEVWGKENNKNFNIFEINIKNIIIGGHRHPEN